MLVGKEIANVLVSCVKHYPVCYLFPLEDPLYFQNLSKTQRITYGLGPFEVSQGENQLGRVSDLFLFLEKFVSKKKSSLVYAYEIKLCIEIAFPCLQNTNLFSGNMFFLVWMEVDIVS